MSSRCARLRFNQCQPDDTIAQFAGATYAPHNHGTAEGTDGLAFLNSGQYQLHPQAANGCVAELEIAAVERSEFQHDGEAEPGTRLGFVEPQAAPRHLIALRRIKAGTVVVDDDAHDGDAVATFGHHFDAY